MVDGPDECPRADFEHEALQLTSLNRLIEWLGGNFSFQAREKIYDQARSDGLVAFAETFVVQKPNTGISLSQISEPYTGTTSQNQILLFFLRSRLVLDGYRWDVKTNYLKKTSAPSPETKACDPSHPIEQHILKETGLTLEQITPQNRLLALSAFETFLKQYPQENIPLETVHGVMGTVHENMITIDDGPNENTLEMLDVLDRAGVCAIFYLIGKNVKKYPEEVKAIVKRGHLVGYHTMNHQKNYENKKLENDFEDFQATLDETLGTHYPLVFVRVPYGTDATYEAYKTLKNSEDSTLKATTYLPQADLTPRAYNWDIQDNFLRDKEWQITDANEKAEYYRDRYQNHGQQIFLLHQEADDVLALQTMLSVSRSTP